MHHDIPLFMNFPLRFSLTVGCYLKKNFNADQIILGNYKIDPLRTWGKSLVAWVSTNLVAMVAFNSVPFPLYLPVKTASFIFGQSRYRGL